MKLSIVIAAAVNDDVILDMCLRASPDIAAGAVCRAYRGYRSAAAAYNAALDEASEEIVVFAHQDVYLPEGWLRRLQQRLDELDTVAPDWAVAGPIGADRTGTVHGEVWSSGLGKCVGRRPAGPVEVEALDEMILIVRRDAGLRFDERLRGFHLYGADIIQIARSAGRSAWVIDAPAVHHSRPVLELGGSYRAAWNYLRRKWWSRLPIANLVCPLTRSPLRLMLTDWRFRRRNRHHQARVQPTDAPAAIARRLGWE